MIRETSVCVYGEDGGVCVVQCRLSGGRVCSALLSSAFLGLLVFVVRACGHNMLMAAAGMQRNAR